MSIIGRKSPIVYRKVSKAALKDPETEFPITKIAAEIGKTQGVYPIAYKTPKAKVPPTSFPCLFSLKKKVVVR